MTCERCERPIREGASPCMLLFFDRVPPTLFFCSLGCIDMWMMKMPNVPKECPKPGMVPRSISGVSGVSILEGVKGKVFV